jgi:NAD-dependent deacetylase
MPYQMPRIETALGNADVFLSIGTSGLVYPAAGFGQLARYAGARTIEANLEETAGSSSFDRCVRGKAGEVLPGLVDELLEMGS